LKKLWRRRRDVEFMGMKMLLGQGDRYKDGAARGKDLIGERSLNRACDRKDDHDTLDGLHEI